MTTRFRKPEAMLRQKIKKGQTQEWVSSGGNSDTGDQKVSPGMKHSTKETFSKYLCQKLRSSNISEPYISIRQGQEGRKILNIRAGNRPWNPERF